MLRIFGTTEKWDDIAYLKGALNRKEAEPVRSLILEARALTPGVSDNEVLLLPGDPNLESWFARPRPELSSPVIFVDQYYDRFVEEDFKRLLTNPPRLIIIGPDPFWRYFFYHWSSNYGTERLINQVSKSLLPEKYTLAKELKMDLEYGPESFQIFVRK